MRDQFLQEGKDKAMLEPMFGKNRRLVTNAPVVFKV